MQDTPFYDGRYVTYAGRRMLRAIGGSPEGDPPPADPPAADPPPPSGDKTFTQDQLDKVVGERLARERDKFADYEDVKAKAARLDEIENEKRSDVEKLTGERDTLKGERDTFKTDAETKAHENLRLRVALDKRLPAELVDRLQGETKEDLEADADKLLGLVKTPTGGWDGGARENATAELAPGLPRLAAAYSERK